MMGENRDEAKRLKVIHLPIFQDNEYQPLLLTELQRLAVEAFPGDGGGPFFLTALQRWRADILHFHWLYPYLFSASWWSSLVQSSVFILQVLILRLAGLRIVWTIHNLANHEQRYPRLERFFTTLFCRCVDAFIVHCKAAQRAACNRYYLRRPCRLRVIPHGNYIGCYKNQMSRSDARRRLDIPDERLVFVFIGKVRPYKGILELIDAFNRLDACDVLLLIAGKPSDSAENQVIRDRIGGRRTIKFFPQFVPNDDLQTFLNAADVAVFPYRDILTSGSLVLAMSFGLPTVVPRLGCIPETIGPSSGFLYDPQDPDGLYGAMAEALRQRSHLGELGKHSRRMADEVSWARVAQMTLDVYRSMSR